MQTSILELFDPLQLSHIPRSKGDPSVAVVELSVPERANLLVAQMSLSLLGFKLTSNIVQLCLNDWAYFNSSGLGLPADFLIKNLFVGLHKENLSREVRVF